MVSASAYCYRGLCRRDSRFYLWNPAFRHRRLCPHGHRALWDFVIWNRCLGNTASSMQPQLQASGVEFFFTKLPSAWESGVVKSTGAWQYLGRDDHHMLGRHWATHLEIPKLTHPTFNLHLGRQKLFPWVLSGTKMSLFKTERLWLKENIPWIYEHHGVHPCVPLGWPSEPQGTFSCDPGALWPCLQSW